MSAPIEFGELPGGTNAKGNSKWFGVVEELKARPGEWAKIETKQAKQTAYSAVGNIRRGLGAWAPLGAFEAAVRGCDVWARYVGDES